MDDSLEIVSVGSSPPGSPFIDLPVFTQNKVSEMCKGSKTLGDIPFTFNYNSYHSLSDSEDENVAIGCAPVNLDDNLNKLNKDETSDNIIMSSTPTKLSQKSRKTKAQDILLDKKKLKEIKALEKAEKAKEKAERAATLEKVRQSKPGQCLKYVTIIVDEDIIVNDEGKKVMESFKNVEFKYKVVKQGDPCSITWTREEPGIIPTVTQEKHILFVWAFDKIITSIKYCTLIESFRELKNKYNGFRMYLAIFGRGEYYKKLIRRCRDKSVDNGDAELHRKRRKTCEISTSQIETALAELEVLLKVSTRLLKNHQELSQLLHQITKAIAETPYKKEIEKRDLEKCWYARGDSRDCVKVDKDLNGLYRLWLQQLSQFNKSSLDVARSIAEMYPSPYALYEAYQSRGTQKEKDVLLQDIQVKRGNSITRRIGPELSRKISLLFSQENGDIHLSQE